MEVAFRGVFVVKVQKLYKNIPIIKNENAKVPIGAEAFELVYYGRKVKMGDLKGSTLLHFGSTDGATTAEREPCYGAINATNTGGSPLCGANTSLNSAIIRRYSSCTAPGKSGFTST